MSTRKGWFLGILSYLLMGVNPPLAKWLLENGMDPGSLLTARFILGTAIYFVFLSSTQFSVPKGEEKPLEPQGRKFAILAGLLNGVNLIFYFSSLQFLSASVTSVLAGAQYLVFTILLLALLGERLTGFKLIRLGLGLAGIYFLVDPVGNNTVDLWGLFLVFGASVTFTLQLVIVQYYLKPYNIWHVSQIMVSCATLLPVSLWLFQGWQTGTVATFVPGIQGWLFIFVLAFFATFLARWTQFSATTSIGSGEMALLSPLGTAVILLIAFLLLGEMLTISQWIGTIIVMIAVALAGFAPKPNLAVAGATNKAG